MMKGKGQKKIKQETGKRGILFEHRFPGRAPARTAHIFVYVNGRRPEFRPACELRQTRVAPHGLVSFREDEHCCAASGLPGWVVVHYDPGILDILDQVVRGPGRWVTGQCDGGFAVARASRTGPRDES